MARISVPTTAQLHPGVRIEAGGNPGVLKALNRLSRPSLLSLALEWLRDENQPLTAPYLRPRRTRPRRRPRQEEAEDDADSQDDDDGDDDDEGDFYPPLSSLAALRDYYADLAGRRGSKREVLDRIVDGDWRGGLTLYQLAMADLQHLHDHPTSLKWAAYKMVPLRLRSGEGGDDEAEVEVEVDRTATAAPKFHPSTFLARLAALMPPDVKAFFNFERHRSLPLLLLRVLIVESPYGTGLAFGGSGRKGDGGVVLEGARTVYIAFPDAAPFVYVSRTSSAAPGGGGGETRSLAALVLEAVPRALSRPRDRVALRPTHLVTRNLAELLLRRGAGRTNAAGGGWAVYADEKKRESPLDTVLPSPPLSDGERRLVEEADEDEGAGEEKMGKKRLRTVDEEREERAARRRKLVAQARFGSSARVGDEKGVERVDITMLDPFPGAPPPPPPGDEVEDETPEDERVRSRGPKLRGRRSTLDLQFRREAEEEEDDNGGGGASAGGGGGPQTHDDAGWRPRVRLTFHGSHVFAGLRQLVEAGVIDGEKMPGWMTGEEGVTVGAVQHGRIRGHKGSGI